MRYTHGNLFAELKGVLIEFLHQIFGDDEPIQLPEGELTHSTICRPRVKWISVGGKQGNQIKWLLVMGAGMVHRHVFQSVGYDPEAVSGFAFGCGVDRFTIEVSNT